MSKHTPEPWKAFVRRSGGRYTIAVQAAGCPDVVSWPGFDDSNRSYREHAANARRIVACVNACEGINPKAVPELLETLRRIAFGLSVDARLADGWTKADAIAAANAAIAQVEPPPTSAMETACRTSPK